MTQPLKITRRRWLLPLAAGLLIAAPAFAYEAGMSEDEPATAPDTTNDAAGALPDPEAWEAGPDRETLVRFARAYGQVSNVLDAEADIDPLDESLQDPDQLPADIGREVERHIQDNGLDTDEWSALLARMERDEDFRTRVEMLALPYRDAPAPTPAPEPQ